MTPSEKAEEDKALYKMGREFAKRCIKAQEEEERKRGNGRE